MLHKKFLSLFLLVGLCFSPLGYAASDKTDELIEKPAQEAQDSENTVVSPPSTTSPEPTAVPLIVEPKDQIKLSDGAYDYYGRKVCWRDRWGRRHCRWR